MKTRMIGVLSFGFMLLLSVMGSFAADDEKVMGVDISADYFGKYIWRGQNINDESVLQTNVSGSAYGFTGSIWANIDLTNGSQSVPNNAGEFSEIDYTLDYSASIPGAKKLGVSVGVIHYLFPNTTFSHHRLRVARPNLVHSSRHSLVYEVH